MNIGVPREIGHLERRVALTPDNVKTLIKKGHRVAVEKNGGRQAFFSDFEYVDGGAVIIESKDELYGHSDIIFKVKPPVFEPGSKRHELDLMPDNSAYIGFLSPYEHHRIIEGFLPRNITSFSMEFIPRISRAQSMDALSSMANIAGYKSVLKAADCVFPKMFPLLMTAAGTIPPTRVLILGAGVAGLQAIATARRLGATVEAFDPRPAVREQVMSLGATFVDMEIKENMETSGGYAREQSDDFLKREQAVIASRLPKIDVVITTAQIFGKKAPILITRDMVKLMKPGSVIIDIAAEQGGNCQLSKPGKTVVFNRVVIAAPLNLPSALPYHASQMYSKNVCNLFLHLYNEEKGQLDFTDEITRSACLTHNGEIVNEYVKTNFKMGG